MKYKADITPHSPSHHNPNTTAGIDQCPTTDPALFGPITLPVFYTALKSPPSEFRWEVPSAANQSQDMMITVRHNGEKEPLYSFQTKENCGHSIDLKEADFCPETIYAWKVESCSESFLENAECFQNLNQETTTVAEGCFWILDEDNSDRAYQLKHYFNFGSADYDYLALALLLAEKHLYQDSLKLCENASLRNPRSGHFVISNFVQAAIYRYMHENLNHRIADIPIEVPVNKISCWIERREKYHRSLVSDHIQKWQLPE